MYEAKQNKEKVSRRIDRNCRTTQNMRIKGGRRSVSNIGDIVQTFQVIKNGNNKNMESYINIGKAMKSPIDKINFYEFIESKEKNEQTFLSLDQNFILKTDRPKGREDYYIAITDNCNNGNYWINWPANCTGDLPSMSTAILMGFKHGINITGYGSVNSQSKLSEINAYLGGILDKKDNRFIINNDGWKGTYNKNIRNGLKFSWLTRVVATGKYKDDKTGIEEVVKKTGYDEKDQEKVRKTWLGEDNVDEKIEKWLNSQYNIVANSLKNKNITILWIRKSGERGGAHFENDTSFKAIGRYIRLNNNGLIVLAGDKKNDKTNKLVDIAKDRVYDLTEFWKKSNIADWGGNTRTGQLKLYDYLNRLSGGKLKHIGSMSGGLEALSLLGHNVEFKAKSGEVGVTRMEQYKYNDILKYNRINFDGNHRFYDYKGFEKSSAKYYAFFSSGIVNGKLNKDNAYDLYRQNYNPQKDYKIAGSGLNSLNAQIALTVSKELAKREKEAIILKIEERARQKQVYEQMISQSNPNRPQGFKRTYY